MLSFVSTGFGAANQQDPTDELRAPDSEMIPNIFIVSLRTHGPGPDPEKLRLMLKPFGKVVPEEVRAEDDEGEGAKKRLGLGLALANDIIELHGGRLECVSLGTLIQRDRQPHCLIVQPSNKFIFNSISSI